MTRNGGMPLVSSQPGTGTLSSIVHQGLNAANVQVNVLDDILLWLKLQLMASL